MPAPARPALARLALAAGLAALAALAQAAPGRAAGAQAPQGAPEAAPVTWLQGRVAVDSLRSPALGTWKRFVVALPPSYDREPARRYPVVYWLHGLWGDEWNWVRQGGLARTADSLAAAGRGEAILVMPDGDDSWYTTWNALGTEARCRADTTRREPAATYCVPWPRYDDYVARDLVARVDSAYRTWGVREARAIAGLSMGGYGAVSLALRYPDVWRAAASHSGVLAPLLVTDASTAPRWAADVPTLARRWGAYWTTIPLAFGRDTAGWWARDPGRLVARLRGPGGAARPARLPALFVDVGTEDMLLAQNRAFRRTLDSLGVPVRYAEHPGGHTWAYWRAHAPASLAWALGEVGAAPRAGDRAAAGQEGR